LVASEPQPFTEAERVLLREIVAQREPRLLELARRLANEELVPRAEIEPLEDLLSDEWSAEDSERGYTEREKLLDSLISKLFEHTPEFWA